MIMKRGIMYEKVFIVICNLIIYSCVGILW